jgi:hypothetical protein
MLVEDKAAFIEQFEVRRQDRRAEKRRRRRMQAEIAALRAEADARLAAEALRKMEEELATLHASAPNGPGRRLLAVRRERLLEHWIATVRGRLRAKQGEAMATRKLLRRLDQSGKREAPPPGARVFRLHSAHHHLECSERRFARLASSQAELPVLVERTHGRSWWWYRERFWWDEDGLEAHEVRVFVLDADLSSRQRAESSRQTLTTLLDIDPAVVDPAELSPIVRFAVWCRDGGRCVDCRTTDDVGWDEILPPENGGSRTAANVELRCGDCRDRRELNQVRTRVSRAQVDATSQVL